MSIFRPINVACPACGEATEFDAVYSVNADRRPDLRDGIIDQTFQRRECAKCAKSFRLDPQLVYLDVERDQWIAALPFEQLGQWEAKERESQAIYEQSFGPEAGPDAQEIGATLQPRLVFGWPALREKLILRDRGLDDVSVELLKIAVIRGLGEMALDSDWEMRLINITNEGYALAWINATTEEVQETLVVPLEMYAEIRDDEDSWRELREKLSPGLFVDMQRLLMETEAEAAAS